MSNIEWYLLSLEVLLSGLVTKRFFASLIIPQIIQVAHVV